MQLVHKISLFAACVALAVACSTSSDRSDDNSNGTTTHPDAGTPTGGSHPDAGTVTDPGTGPAEGDDCGELDELGKCFGTSAKWCGQDGKVAVVDCGSLGQDDNGNDLVAACGDLKGFGAWCVLPENSQCYFEDQNGSTLFACGIDTAASTNLVCDVTNGCIQTPAPCTAPEGDAKFVPVCNGNAVIVDCLPYDQGLQLDCTDPNFGATGCADGACVGMPAGKTCNDLFKCAEGLTCDAQTKKCVQPT